MAESFPPGSRPSRLFAYLAPACTLLIVYASLHPFTGWRIAGDPSPFRFLGTRWPLYWTFSDITFNIAAYIPLGFLFVPFFRNRVSARKALALSCVFCAALSFCLESLQTYLASRVPSNLDLVCNAAGAFLGALSAFLIGDRLIDEMAAIRAKFLVAPHAEAGIVLIALWLLAQLSPESILFGTGNLRTIFKISIVIPYAPALFFALEACIVALHTAAAGLFVSVLLHLRKRALFPAILVFFCIAIALRSLAGAILVDAAHAFSWMTPGSRLGLLCGFALLFLVLALPRASHVVFAGLALMMGTAFVNIAPTNAYSMIMDRWNQGHFLNFNGLTRLVSTLWPFLAFVTLIAMDRRNRAVVPRCPE
ncbi:MAG: VanZ family protein [Candidatus Accumulibacter sp.]|jgi:VanZ family protein|nr:VanZ family protein [Accumulibacter sp.]